MFYAADADCVGMTGAIDWALNKQWTELLSLSGTPFFLSVDPKKLTPGQKDDLTRAIRTYLSVDREAEPLDWMDNAYPEIWDTAQGRRVFPFPEEF